MNEARSFLRKREAWWRSNPQADSHVRFYLTNFTATDRMEFVCPSCTKVIRNLDRPRDSSGRLKKHCGCRLLELIKMDPVQVRVRILERKTKYRRNRGVQTLEEKRIASAHRKQSRQMERDARTLHDSHVKSFKSDINRYHRWMHAYRPSYALYHRLKSWMHKHLRDRIPSQKWSRYLGYTTDELRVHLERQFNRGMSWENKGKWHIDHIRPVASFDIQSIDSEEFRDCFGLHNLRPVWAKENMRKGSKREFLL